MRILFMGTPEFAVTSLKALIEAGEEVVAVVTTPDKPAGRGQKIHQSAVKEYALAHNIPVLQPTKLKDPDFIAELQQYAADLHIVVAFRMLPEVVWSMPKHGTVNVHASLLPQFRGAAPINHAIIQGEKISGVTTFLLQHEIDTGNIIFQQKVAIEDQDNAGSLHDKLMVAGAAVLLRTVQALKDQNIQPIPQENLLATGISVKHAPKIFKEDCIIDWAQPTEQVFNKIRGLSPYPAAFTQLKGKVLKVYETEKATAQQPLEPGEIASDGKTFLQVGTLDGALNILQLQLEGKKKIHVEEFLRGYRLEPSGNKLV